MARTRVIVVDDDDFTRSMVVSSLQMQDYDVISESSTASSAIKTAIKLKPEVAILDLDLGTGPNGVDLALALRREIPRIAIVMLTTFEDPRFLSPNIPMLPEGSLYLVKREVGKIEKLGNAIEQALLNAKKLSKSDKSVQAPRANLTDNQVEILRLVAIGLSNAQIAKQRGINEKSVEQTISRITKELNLTSGAEKNSRVQLTRYYQQFVGGKISNA
jgi:DNA-binding NarL/FixJ family response regulator